MSGRPSLSHPLLELSPQARRQLARTLVSGLKDFREDQRARHRQGGLVGAGVYGVVGTGLWAGWHALTGGAFLPFAAWYGVLGGIQGVVGAIVEESGEARGPAPLRALLLAPYAAVRALKTWVVPERVTADRLVLAAGLLTGVRRPVSTHLLRRLYARAYPQTEVDQALTLLVHLGYVQYGTPGVVCLTPDGISLLIGLGVAAPSARPRQEPEVAPHLWPLFSELERRVRSLEAGARKTPADPLMPLPQAGPQLPRVERELPFPARQFEPQLDFDDDDEIGRPLDAAAGYAWRIAAVAAAIALFGSLFLATRGWHLPERGAIALSASLMPGNSQGTAIQLNGRGMMLSSFGGGLYLSLPERMDFKRPLSFEGYDMASGCGLISREVREARLSPTGRFLWTEMGGDAAAGPRERCLVDLETRTVSHDLVARNSAYGLPGLVGWAGQQTLLMSEEASPRQADKWWLLDVVSHRATTLHLPEHRRILPLATEDGVILLGMDMQRQGVWDLTPYWLDSTHEYQATRTVHTTFPAAMREAEPRHAALSPDKRFLLLSLKPAGVEVPAQEGTLLVVRLEDGEATALGSGAKALPDAPIFWGPDVSGGRYRFYFNGTGPDGVVPLAGDLTVESPS